MNGAKEKYAPVRAAPRWRSASINITRLIPTPRKPVIAPAATIVALGNPAPSPNAIARLVDPASKPLSMAICTGSAEESFRVRLLSMPQHKHAAAMKRAPISRLSAWPFHERRTAPATMAAAPSSRRLSTFSRNTTHAIAIVARLSKLSNSEPDAADVRDSPNMRKIGPSIPPKTMTAASHGISGPRSGASILDNPSSGRPQCIAAKPNPAPRYRIPASSHGSTEPISNFESGADAPNKAAAPRASGTPGHRWEWFSDMRKCIPLFCTAPPPSPRVVGGKKNYPHTKSSRSSP